MGAFPPPQGGNHYYYYYNAGPPPRNPGPPDDDCDALAREGKLDIQRPKLFMGRDPQRWRTFLTQCLNLFQAKPVTFQLDNTHVAFAASYLQGIVFDHYTALLWFELQSPVLSNWQFLVNEFSTKFGVFNTVAEAKDNLRNLQMRSNERFTTFIVRFKKEAYETGWNYNALYPQPPFIRNPITNNQTPGPRPPAQLNASDTIKAPEPNPDKPVDPDALVNDSAFPKDKEALRANRFCSSNKSWIDVPLNVQEHRQKEGACILCGERGHFIGECPKCPAMGRAVWTFKGKECEYQSAEHDPTDEIGQEP
ncbi:hypothetical protein C0992_005523 [Termitomyces sp. T32_za158]|nr:hypothetical protein C0992_005523 [Termitomyces sp. T32_za158]